MLKPWKGYAISVADTDVLTFRPFIEPEILTTSQVNEFLSFDYNWQIQIAAQCESAYDDKNYAGVRINSVNDWDKNDFFEPPPFGEYVMVSFPHPEWGKHLTKYTTDYKTPNELGYIWDFEVVSNLTDKIILTFSNIEKVPSEFDVWLRDDLLNISQDLRLNNNYEVAGRGEKYPKRLKLIVGRNEFIDKNITDQNYLPDSYELCQNFPNPFNPSTTIRYGLPHEERVILKIHNILGDEIVMLVDNELQAKGYHVAIWDGRDQNGKSVANGIYMYKFKAGNFSMTKKMLLMK